MLHSLSLTLSFLHCLPAQPIILEKLPWESVVELQDKNRFVHAKQCYLIAPASTSLPSPSLPLPQVRARKAVLPHRASIHGQAAGLQGRHGIIHAAQAGRSKCRRKGLLSFRGAREHVQTSGTMHGGARAGRSKYRRKGLLSFRGAREKEELGKTYKQSRPMAG